jgi:hypothetical protein
MRYNHQWGKPSIMMVSVAGRPVATPQQPCLRCGTTRNAITRELVRLTRGSWCRGAERSPDPEYPAEMRRIEEALAAYAADGLDVDRHYTGDRPKKPKAPELWHHYSD